MHVTAGRVKGETWRSCVTQKRAGTSACLVEYQLAAADAAGSVRARHCHTQPLQLSSPVALTLTPATRASLRSAPLPTSANLSPAAATTEAASQRLAGAAVYSGQHNMYMGPVPAACGGGAWGAGGQLLLACGQLGRQQAGGR